MSANAKLDEIEAELKEFQSAAQPSSSRSDRSAVGVRITQTLPLLLRIARMVADAPCSLTDGEEPMLVGCGAPETWPHPAWGCWPCRVRRELETAK